MDITYIPMARGFVYLAAVVDWFSRRVLAWKLSITMAWLGGLKTGVHGRQTETKALIVVAAEEDGKGIGWIRMRPIPDASAQSLIPFVRESVEPGGLVHTDGWLGYRTQHDGQEKKDTGQYDQPRRVTYTPTCRLLVRRSVFDRVGLMNQGNRIWNFVEPAVTLPE